MTEYRPPQRQVRSSIFTEIGWLTGTFHCNARQTLVDYLNAQASFFKLTDVTMPGAERALPFLALQRTKVIVLSPSERDESPEKQPVDSEEHAVSCIFQDGIISGTLRTRPRQRVSDFLVSHHGFFMLRDCLLRARTTSKEGVVKKLPLAIINDRALLGVTEA